MSNAGSLMMSNRNKVVDGLNENSDKRVGTAIDGIWVGKRGEMENLRNKTEEQRIRKSIPKPRKKHPICKPQVSAQREHSQVSN